MESGDAAILRNCFRKTMFIPGQIPIHTFSVRVEQ